MDKERAEKYILLERGALYREWLERMSGLSFSIEDAIKEMKAEIDRGNEKEVARRLKDIAYVKSIGKDNSKEFADEVESILTR